MKDGRYREPDVEIYAKGELAVEFFRDSLLDFKMVRALRKCCTIASSHRQIGPQLGIGLFKFQLFMMPQKTISAKLTGLNFQIFPDREHTVYPCIVPVPMNKK